MSQRMRSVVILTLLALFTTIALPQRHGRADALTNYLHGSGQLPTTAVRTKSFPRRNWTLKYASGSLRLKPDQWLRIAFVSRSALDRISPVISVPTDKLITVEYAPKTEKDSELLQGPRYGCSYGQTMMPDTAKARPELVVAIPIYPGHPSGRAERLRPKHPVRFAWVQEGKQQSMVLKVNDCEYQSFMANIRWIAGDRWQKIGRELEQ